MNQVGQTLALVVSATPGVVAYIWTFWDGTTQTTRDPHVSKIITSGGTGLTWSCKAVDSVGNYGSVFGTINVNQPPIILAASLSNNDLPSTYTTDLTVTVKDPDSASPISVQLSDVSGSVTQVVSSIVSGHTEGTTVFSLISVTRSVTKLLTVTDADGGVTTIQVEVRAAPTVPILASVSTSPVRCRVGPSAFVTFSCRMTDPNRGSTPTFEWVFLAADGWSVISGFGTVSGGWDSSGTTTALGSFSYQNTVVVPTDGQTGGVRRVKVRVTPSIGTYKDLWTTVEFIQNLSPVFSEFEILSPSHVTAGNPVTILGVASDPDGDFLSYSWAISNSSGPISSGLTSNPLTVTPTTGRVDGVLTVTDGYGGSISVSIPPALISSSLSASGQVSVPFLYLPQAMSLSTGLFTVDVLPSGLSFVDGTISGVPLSAGVTNTRLSFSSADGSDSRTLRIAITPSVVSPSSPTNLRVNGDGTNPRYSSSTVLNIQWTVTTDNGLIPSFDVEFRTVGGELKQTLSTGLGVNVLSVSAAQILSMFGAYQDVSLRVYSVHDGVRSIFPAETQVTYV